MTQPPDHSSLDAADNGSDSNNTDHNASQQRLQRLLRGAARWPQRLPVGQAAQRIVQWFQVDEQDIAAILAAIRAELPTTEALLIGKPQAGKSSIVRGLTGVSAEIVGQGFKPHTRYTERYAYPSDDLPLLVFTDTVGLGDVQQSTKDVVAELMQDLAPNDRARIFILTVKINDFATDTLKRIAQQLRQQFPSVPCLLAVTCLHEVYPAEFTDHPPYPPTDASITRPYEAICADFKGICDRAVMLDFTLEEDGFTPVFYGLEALRDTLADLLPKAEAHTLHQLLRDREAATQQLGDLYRTVGRRYISVFAVMAATIAAVPLPFATMPVLTTLQASMVVRLGQIYGQSLSLSQAGGVVSAIAGGFLAQAMGRELIKFIPGFGSLIAASWATAYTWALGEGACVYFGDLMGGKTPDPDRIRVAMREAFQAAQQRFKQSSS